MEKSHVLVMFDLAVLEIGSNPISLVIRKDLVVQRSKVAVVNVVPHRRILSALTETLFPLAMFYFSQDFLKRRIKREDILITAAFSL